MQNERWFVLAHGERVPKAQNDTKAAFSSLFDSDGNFRLSGVLGQRDALVACEATELSVGRPTDYIKYKLSHPTRLPIQPKNTHVE